MRLVTPYTAELHRDVAAVRAEWDALVDRTGAHPFTRPGWFEAWWGAFGSGALEVVAMRRGAELVALVPLVARGDVLRSPTNWHTPQFSPVALDEPAAGALAGALFARGTRRVVLRFVDTKEVAVAAYLDAARDAGYRLIVRELERSPYLSVAGDFEAYERDRLPAKRRSNLRRLRRRLEDRGRVSIEIADGSSDLEALLDEGFAVEAAGWKGRRGTAIASDERTARFYRAVAVWARDRGWLRLAFLRIDGRALAFDFAIDDGRAHYLLKTGYDERARSDAPGVLLRRAMIRSVFASGVRSYEFLGDVEPSKAEWTDNVRVRMALEAYDRTPAGLIESAVFSYGRPVARRVLALRR